MFFLCAKILVFFTYKCLLKTTINNIKMLNMLCLFVVNWLIKLESRLKTIHL